MDISPRSLGKEVTAINQMSIVFLALLASLPPDITGWEEEYEPNLGNWIDNITSAPVIDNDDWLINFVGHPLSGSIYYVSAKQTGATNMQSFLFSTAMSTLVWEYKTEALYEKPSLQDLVITPIVGSIMGVGIFKLNQGIQNNDGKLWGSKNLGRVGLVLTDPSGAFQSAMDRLGKGRIKDVKFSLRPVPAPGINERISYKDQLIGIGIDFKIGRPSPR